MMIPVIRINDEKQDRITWLNIVEVTHILRTRKEIQFHTPNGIFVFPNALEYWKEPLLEHGFERVDWSVLANMNHLVRYDEKQQTIYLNQLSKGIPIAKKHISKVLQQMSTSKEKE